MGAIPYGSKKQFPPPAWKCLFWGQPTRERGAKGLPCLLRQMSPKRGAARGMNAMYRTTPHGEHPRTTLATVRTFIHPTCHDDSGSRVCQLAMMTLAHA